MEDKNTYRVPEGFHPQICMDTIRGLTDAIHQHMTEGPGTARIQERGSQGGLIALIDLLLQHVHELHAYLIEIENSTTLKLPLTDSDFESLHLKNARKDEVKEPAAFYSIRQPHSHQNDEAHDAGFQLALKPGVEVAA